MRALLLLLAFLPSLAFADMPPPVKGRLTLTHVSKDAWRADYRLEERVDAIEFGPAVVNFRGEAWAMATPGVELATDADKKESVRSTGKPFDALRVNVKLYEPWAHDSYVPMDRHSDGGTAIYLGHFMGGVRQNGVLRNMLLQIELKGLPGETVFLPEEANRDIGVYAYVGPQEISAIGGVRAIIDPATPTWVREAMADTAAKLANVYEAKLGRPAPRTLALIVGAAGLAKPGYSIKGGALPGQVVYKLEGNQLTNDSPLARERLQQMVAHELSHVWQGLVARGGIGDTQPWVHEGGAEALSSQALLQSGLWTPEQLARYSTGMQKECQDTEAKRAADPAMPTAWREHYTCGYVRYQKLGVDIFALWKGLMARSEASGEPYSEAMVQAVAKESTPAR
ncbi:hypothetical protein [Arenimonas sp.]|uniref:hypothetical protein n=1 Tax=Arenimonas sp. TaxID=1872635 RepID=UPI0039E56A06